MLSVKQVEESGHESIVLAETVEFFPHGDEVGSSGYPPKDGKPMLLAYGVVGGGLSGGYNRYGGPGRVYVMNDSGKTIAAYDL